VSYITTWLTLGPAAVLYMQPDREALGAPPPYPRPRNPDPRVYEYLPTLSRLLYPHRREEEKDGDAHFSFVARRDVSSRLPKTHLSLRPPIDTPSHPARPAEKKLRASRGDIVLPSAEVREAQIRALRGTSQDAKE
jgi:hypothetical protein